MLVKEVAVDIFFFNRSFCLLGSKIISLSSQVNFNKLTPMFTKSTSSFFYTRSYTFDVEVGWPHG